MPEPVKRALVPGRAWFGLACTLGGVALACLAMIALFGDPQNRTIDLLIGAGAGFVCGWLAKPGSDDA